MNRSQLALLALALVVASMALWSTLDELTGQSVPVLPDARQAAQASEPLVDTISGLNRRKAAATQRRSGSTRLRLIQVSSGSSLSTPATQVRDPQLERPFQLSANQGVDLQCDPPRQVDLEASPGWQLSTTRIELSAQSPTEFTVVAEPTNIVALTVSERSSGQPVEDITLQAIWISSKNKIRSESSPRQLHGAAGRFLIDGIPLGEGRFKLRVSSGLHHQAQTEWIQTRAGWVHGISIELQNRRIDSTTLRVVVRDEETLQPRAGVTVRMFEDRDEAPIVGLRIQDSQLVVQRGSPFTYGQFQVIAPKQTNGLGEATFEVPSQVVYRAVAQDSRYPLALGAPMEAIPGQEQIVELLLPTPSVLEGVLVGPGLTSSKMANYVIDLVGNGTQRQAVPNHDGRFSFDVLARGDYQISVVAPLNWGPDNAGQATPLSMPITLDAGERRTVTLDLGHADSPRTIACTISPPFSSSAWSFIVALVPTGNEDLLTVNEPLFQTVETSGEAEFGFFGIPDGKWGLLALGQTTNGSDRCFLMAKVLIKDGVADRSLVTLEEAGAPLVVTGAALPKDKSATYTIHYPDASFAFNDMLTAKLPLGLKSGSTLRIMGLPEGRIELHHGETIIEVNDSRRLSCPLQYGDGHVAAIR